MSESINRFVCVEHTHDNSRSLELVDLEFSGLCSALGSESHCESTRLLHDSISCFVLVSKGVSSNDDRLSPSRNESWNVLDYDGLTEDCAIQLITDGTVW